MSRELTSIMTEDLEHCYIHKKYLGIEVQGTELHHACHGVANRRVADREKLFCRLCKSCHAALHDKGYHDLDLQQDAERAWLEYNNANIADWIKLIGKNYLEEEST